MKNQKRAFDLDSLLRFGQYSRLTVSQIYSGIALLPSAWCNEVLKRVLYPNESGFVINKKRCLDMFDIKFVERRLTMSLKKDHEHMQDYNGFNLQVCNYWHEINNFLTEYYFGIPHANGSATLYSEHFFEDKAREGMINYNDMMGTDYFSLEERFTLRYGQPAYISWLIQNVNYFSLLPSDLNLLEELEINNFLGIWVKRINEHNFLPTPAFTKRKEKFPEHIKALNEKKWELFQSQMINNASNDNFEDNKSGSKYSYSDGYGGFVSDNFIDDVLDGEADAYWNLD